MIAKLSAAGEVLCRVRVAHALGISTQKYATLSRMIATAELMCRLTYIELGFIIGFELVGN